MRGMKIVTVAGVPACMIGAAKAEELVGTIDAIDTTRNAISARGQDLRPIA